jgi:hypothetical protein
MPGTALIRFHGPRLKLGMRAECRKAYQETNMLVRTATLMASIFIAGQALAGDPVTFAPVENGVITRPRPAAAQLVLAPPGFGQLNESADARGPAAHAQQLKQIAVYAATGNRDGVEIASRQLRQFGVTREDVQDAIDRTHLHGDGIDAPLLRQSENGIETYPELRVSY